MTLVSQADTHRAAVGIGPLVVDVAHVDELLEVIRNVRTEVIAARLELTGRQLALTDVVKQEGLHAVEFGAALAIEFVLDDVEQEPMQPLDQPQRLEVFTAEA